MTRKRFILTLLFGMAGLFGFSAFVDILSGKHKNHNLADKSYGSGNYGE